MAHFYENAKIFRFKRQKRFRGKFLSCALSLFCVFDNVANVSALGFWLASKGFGGLFLPVVIDNRSIRACGAFVHVCLPVFLVESNAAEYDVFCKLLANCDTRLHNCHVSHKLA